MKILLSGMLNHSGGYSELTRNLALCLNDLGALAELEIRDKDIFQAIPIENFCSKEYLELEKKLTGDKAKVYTAKPDAVIQFCPPFMFQPVPEGLTKNIGFSMFETRMPEGWFNAVSRLNHLVLHDEFQLGVFGGNGMAERGAPNVMRHLWTPWIDKPKAYPYKNMQPFLLTVGVARMHKNQSKVIEAYRMIKAEFPGLLLVIKAITEDPEYDDYRNLIAGDPDIRVLPGTYSTAAMDNLYQNCSAYISASMCEGLDMPAVKAAMCGKPVVAGWHTGHMSWMPENHVSLVTKEIDMSTVKNIHPRYREPNMRGFDCDIVHLAAHMRSALTPGEAAGYMIDTSNLFTREACKNSLDKLLKSIA